MLIYTPSRSKEPWKGSSPAALALAQLVARPPFSIADRFEYRAWSVFKRKTCSPAFPFDGLHRDALFRAGV